MTPPSFGTSHHCIRKNPVSRVTGIKGYRVGDIRGGISITLPTDEIDRAKRRNLCLMILGGLVSSGVISVLIYTFMH